MSVPPDGPGLTPEDQALACELIAIVARDGIVLTLDQAVALLPRFRDIRRHIELVNRTSPAEGEPAVVFVPPASGVPLGQSR